MPWSKVAILGMGDLPPLIGNPYFMGPSKPRPKLGLMSLSPIILGNDMGVFLDPIAHLLNGMILQVMPWSKVAILGMGDLPPLIGNPYFMGPSKPRPKLGLMSLSPIILGNDMGVFLDPIAHLLNGMILQVMPWSKVAILGMGDLPPLIGNPYFMGPSKPRPKLGLMSLSPIILGNDMGVFLDPIAHLLNGMILQVMPWSKVAILGMGDLPPLIGNPYFMGPSKPRPKLGLMSLSPIIYIYIWK